MDNHQLNIFIKDLFQLKKQNLPAAEKIFQSMTFEQQVELVNLAPVEISREILFLSKDAKEILKFIPKQKFGDMSLQEYLEDSLVILSNCTPEQFAYSVDIDLWKLGEIDHDRFKEWVEVIKELPGHHFEYISDHLDVNLLSSCLKKYVEINLDPTQLILMEHLEKEHQYSMHDISIENAEIEAFVQYIYFHAPELFSNIIRNISIGDSQEIINEAKGERDDRLSKEKMPSFEEAQTIYTKISDFDFSYLNIASKTETSTADVVNKYTALENSYYETVRNYDNFDFLIKPKKEIDIIRNMAIIANSVIVADGISPSDEFKYREAIKKSHYIFNIGLEYISERSPIKAINYLKEHTPIEIFHIGFTLLCQIKEKAALILHDDEEIIKRYSKLITLQLRFMDQDFPLIYMENEKKARAITNLNDILFLHKILINIEDQKKEIN